MPPNAADLLSLQRLIGNQAVVGMLARTPSPGAPKAQHGTGSKARRSVAGRGSLAVQRALSVGAETGGVGVHRYAPEAEERAPRGVSGAAQADAGHYQYLGHNVFQQVTADSGAWQPVADARFYFHHASSGTLRIHPGRNPMYGQPQPWNPPRPSGSNAGSPLGRSDEDIFPLGWAPVPGISDDEERQAQDLAARLALSRVTEPAGWQVVPTIEGSPLVLLMQVGERVGEGEDWAGRDQQIEATAGQLDQAWAKLVERTGGGVKDSGDWSPAPHSTPRRMRPTSKYFGYHSATEAITGRQNAERPGRTEYEWSHLIGDADGGGNRPDNLVSATTAANTEQLILETVQREYRDLLADNGLQILLAGSAALIPTDVSLPQNYAHVANWLRYTVTIRSPDRSLRVLDHIFDAHRQKISKATTIVMLAQAGTAIDGALEREFGVVRASNRQSARTVPTVPPPPDEGPPQGRTGGDLLTYLEPVCNLDPDDQILVARLDGALALGFSKILVRAALRRYGIPVDEVPVDLSA